MNWNIICYKCLLFQVAAIVYQVDAIVAVLMMNVVNAEIIAIVLIRVYKYFFLFISYHIFGKIMLSLNLNIIILIILWFKKNLNKYNCLSLNMDHSIIMKL